MKHFTLLFLLSLTILSCRKPSNEPMEDQFIRGWKYHSYNTDDGYGEITTIIYEGPDILLKIIDEDEMLLNHSLCNYYNEDQWQIINYDSTFIYPGCYADLPPLLTLHYSISDSLLNIYGPCTHDCFKQYVIND